jgi:hypothetical protein
MDTHGEPVEITFEGDIWQDISGIYCLDETEARHGSLTEFGFIESLDFIASDLAEDVNDNTKLVYDGKSYSPAGPCLPQGQGMVSVRLRRLDDD